MNSQTFTVINAQLVNVAADAVIDSQPAIINALRAVIEAAPIDVLGRTLTLVLPPEALDEIAEGSLLTITIEAAPAAGPGA